VLSGIVGRRDETSTDELVEETTHLIENTWMQPAVAPGPPPTPTAPAPEPPPKDRRWPIVAAIVVAIALVVGGVAAALALARGDDDEDAGPVATEPAVTTTEAFDFVPDPETPATTEEETTTSTAAPPADVTIPISFEVEIPDLREPGSECEDEEGFVSPDASIAVEDEAGREILPPRQLGTGEVFPAFLDNFVCAYDVDLQVPDLDRYIVVLQDTCESEFTRDELEPGFFGQDRFLLENSC
jgi:hypothetical protein